MSGAVSPPVTAAAGAGLTVRVGAAENDLVGDAMASTRCAELASLAEQADIRCGAAFPAWMSVSLHHLGTSCC